METLPKELLCIILSYTNGITNKMCQLTCKWFVDVTKPSLDGFYSTGVTNFMLQLNYPKDVIVEHAIASSSMAAIALLKLPRDIKYMNMAAASGSLKVMKFFKGCGYRYDEETFYNVCYGGHLVCLKYLRALGCAWDDNAMIALKEHAECLAFVRSNSRYFTFSNHLHRQMFASLN